MRRIKNNFIILLLLIIIISPFYLYSSIKLILTKRDDTSYKVAVVNISKNLSETKEKPSEGESLVNRIYPDFHQCRDVKSSRSFEQKGQFWVINNYIKASKEFHCNETVTYTTHAEYYFLDNLVFLTERWQGPISVAVYAPGTDFDEAVKTIIYLRNCVSHQLKDFASFHLYFESEHFPKQIREPSDFQINCTENYSLKKPEVIYRKNKGLLYPVNVGRNIARTNAVTYFVFASDIELYPSINVLPEFLKMIEKNDYTDSLSKRVYVLPVFEVKLDKKVPETKSQLLSMLHNKDAIWFHSMICEACHLPPGAEKWNSSEINPGLSVLEVGKRIKPYKSWEPFYIGTNSEPLFDERLSSEGRANKMTQAYAMCLLGYEYHVLDNAFLVHKPGIKLLNKNVLFSDIVEKQNELIFKKIVKEYKAYYGNRKECIVMGSPSKKSFEEVRNNSKNAYL